MANKNNKHTSNSGSGARSSHRSQKQQSQRYSERYGSNRPNPYTGYLPPGASNGSGQIYYPDSVDMNKVGHLLSDNVSSLAEAAASRANEELSSRSQEVPAPTEERSVSEQSAENVTKAPPTKDSGSRQQRSGKRKKTISTEQRRQELIENNREHLESIRSEAVAEGVTAALKHTISDASSSAAPSAQQPAPVVAGAAPQLRISPDGRPMIAMPVLDAEGTMRTVWVPIDLPEGYIIGNTDIPAPAINDCSSAIESIDLSQPGAYNTCVGGFSPFSDDETESDIIQTVDAILSEPHDTEDTPSANVSVAAAAVVSAVISSNDTETAEVEQISSGASEYHEPTEDPETAEISEDPEAKAAPDASVVPEKCEVTADTDSNDSAAAQDDNNSDKEAQHKQSNSSEDEKPQEHASPSSAQTEGEQPAASDDDSKASDSDNDSETAQATDSQSEESAAKDDASDPENSAGTPEGVDSAAGDMSEDEYQRLLEDYSDKSDSCGKGLHETASKPSEQDTLKQQDSPAEKAEKVPKAAITYDDDAAGDDTTAQRADTQQKDNDSRDIVFAGMDKIIRHGYDDDDNAGDGLFLRRDHNESSTAVFNLPEGVKLPAYIDDDDFLDQWLEEGEDDVAANTKRRRRRISAVIGTVTMLFAMIGFIWVLKYTFGAISGMGNTDARRKQFETLISPVVMSEVQPFEKWDTIPVDKLLQSSVFHVLINMEDGHYETDDTNKLVIPSADIIAAAKSLYGSSITFNVDSFNQFSDDDIYYSDTDDCFHVAATGLNGPNGEVTEMSKRGNQISLIVGYVDEAESSDESSYFQTREFVLIAEGNSYYISAVRTIADTE